VHIDSFRRLKSVPVTLVAVATLTLPVLSAVTASSAYASTSSARGTSSSSAAQALPSYTCDTVTVTGPGRGVIPGTVVIKGTGNCVPSNGAPASGTELNNTDVVQRSDGTTYACFGWYGGGTFANTPASVESIACYVSS
jgi:hypothetical protein